MKKVVPRWYVLTDLLNFFLGKGVYEPVALRKWENDKKFNVEIYRYKDTLVHEISGCSLVIGHAGAGTVLDVLEAGKDLVVVPNNSLMSGHQADIAVELVSFFYRISSLDFS